MALLFADSFDHYAMTDILRKWTSMGGTIALVAGTGRNGTTGADLNSSTDQLSKTLYPSSTTVGIAYAIRLTAMPSTDGGLITVWGEAGAQLSLNVVSTGALRLRRGSTTGTVLQTSTATLTLGGWHHVELKAVLHETLGTFEVRLNGVPVLSGTNVDTVGAASPEWVSFTLWAGGAQGSNLYLDDLIVYDGSGSTVNDWVGDCQVRCLLPSTGNGANTGWTPSAGTDHGALVDEPAPNTTDYISGTTPGQRDTFNYPALPVTGTVKGVQVNAYALVETAGIRTLGSVVRSGSTDYDSAGQAPGIGWDYFCYLYPTNPATGAPWTVAEIDAAEFGVKVTA